LTLINVSAYTISVISQSQLFLPRGAGKPRNSPPPLKYLCQSINKRFVFGIQLPVTLVLLSWTAGPFAETGNTPKPRMTAQDAAAGAKIFRSHCAQCHGLNGEGGRGPNLAKGEFYHGNRDADLLRNISDGIPGTEMPGIFFSERQVWQVIAFIRSLSKTDDGAKPAAPAGDVVAGEKIFWGKGACGQCHSIRGRGRRLGPDLSLVGSVRTPSYLRTSLLEPNSEVQPQYWLVSLRDQAGNSYRGYRMHEDTHTLLMMDMQEQLRSFSKKDLSDLKVEKISAMPSVRGILSETELTDVIAFLSSLRRGNTR
jgi:putative heme-binding domain-containing protein